MVHFSHLYMTTGKAIALVIWAFVGKVMSLLFNMLSRFVIAFLPRSKCLLISWQQSPSTVILEPKKIKSVIASTSSPSFCHEVLGPDAMILVFWMLSFKPVIAAAFELAGQMAERSLSLMSHSFTPAFLKVPPNTACISFPEFSHEAAPSCWGGCIPGHDCYQEGKEGWVLRKTVSRIWPLCVYNIRRMGPQGCFCIFLILLVWLYLFIFFF